MLFLSPHLHACFVDHGIDPMQRLVWVLLNIDNHSFGIANIYASNDVVERSLLWRWIADSLPIATWLVYGDFNMVEMDEDKEGVFPFWWIAGECEAWYYMGNKLGLFDPNMGHR